MHPALYISLWAYLFCMPLSQPNEVFGWLKDWIQRTCPDWLYKPLIGCPKCHAGQVALWWQVFCAVNYGEFSLPFILVAIAGAYAMQRGDELIEALIHK